MVFPAWLAVIEQVPTARTVTVFPETVQTDAVVEAKTTGKPEFAVALSVNGATPRVTLLSEAKAMNWIPWVTWKLWLTGDAAAFITGQTIRVDGGLFSKPQWPREYE